MASMLLEKMLLESGMPTDVKNVRVDQAVAGLLEDSVDIAILHAGNVAAAEGIVQQTLLPWHAVLVSPQYYYWPRQDFRNRVRTFVWQPGTFAATLTERFAAVTPELDPSESAHTGSYLSALEMVRRGLPYQLVIPDIYLSRQDRRRLPCAAPGEPIEDALVALCREDARDRWGAYMAPEYWQRALRTS